MLRFPPEALFSVYLNVATVAQRSCSDLRVSRLESTFDSHVASYFARSASMIESAYLEGWS